MARTVTIVNDPDLGSIRTVHDEHGHVVAAEVAGPTTEGIIGKVAFTATWVEDDQP